MIWMTFIKKPLIYSPNKKQKILLLFDDIIADMIATKLIPLVAKLFITSRKINIFLVFITQSYFIVPNNFRLNSTHYFTMKFQKNESFNKQHLIIHQILTLETL